VWPTFIATLTTRFIGRGLVARMTVGQEHRLRPTRRPPSSFFTHRLEPTAGAFNNHVINSCRYAGRAVRSVCHPWGYWTYLRAATLQARKLAGIATNAVRIRAFVISALCATIAGIMNVSASTVTDSFAGFGAELNRIAS